MSVSLNKFISETGFCSRREADDYILQCRVTINGEDAHKGSRVEPGDVVKLDGELIRKKAEPVYIMLHKPKGITCTTDVKDRSNIITYINYKHRIFPIGRLDKLSEGLIFLTNDGDIVNKILWSANGHEKEYIVTVDQPVTIEFIQAMRQGVKILNTKTAPCFVKKEGERKLRIILKQGLNRQIRRMCEALGYRVTALVRIRIMDFTLAGLPVGKWRSFTVNEIAQLQALLKNSTYQNDQNELGE